jgi:hypothetical protein
MMYFLSMASTPTASLGLVEEDDSLVASNKQI